MSDFLAKQKRNRTIALAVFIGSSLLFGIADLLLDENQDWTAASFILDAIVGIVAVACWCRIDSRIQSYPLSGNLWRLIWLVAIIGVPIYLVKSRGWSRAAKIGFGAPAFLLSVGFYYGGWYGAYWVADQTGYFS